MDTKLQTLLPYLTDNVDVTRDNFPEILQGSLGSERGEHFRYRLKGSRERLRYVVHNANRPEVWKALRLGLLLNGYFEELRVVNQILPPIELQEDPLTWRLPLTSIRAYLLQTVDLRRGELREQMASALYRDKTAREALRTGMLGRKELLSIVLDRLNRPEILSTFRRALRRSGYRDVENAIDRALNAETGYLKKMRHRRSHPHLTPVPIDLTTTAAAAAVTATTAATAAATTNATSAAAATHTTAVVAATTAATNPSTTTTAAAVSSPRDI